MNNYRAVATRVPNDKILVRTKPFNVTQLLYFIVSASRAILDVANNRMTSDPGSRYVAEPEEDVQKVGGRMYTVPSVSVTGEVHTVDFDYAPVMLVELGAYANTRQLWHSSTNWLPPTRFHVTHRNCTICSTVWQQVSRPL